MDDFKEGDVVQLKSGGPIMTILEIRDNGEVLCQWFYDAILNDNFFKSYAIEKIEE